MKKLKVDFTIDYENGEKIPITEIRERLKKIKNKCYYLSEIAKFYYTEKYNKDILKILEKKFTIPKCPITGKNVSYKLAGNIIFGKFSSECSAEQISNYVAQNNEQYKAHVEKMKIDRKGSGNPMFGKEAWNKELTKENDERVKKISEDRKGINFSQSTLEKMSESAKRREFNGHTGIKHSEESKQIMREKTIARLKKGSFPQTNSLPHKIVKQILEEMEISFKEEEKIGFYSFDFKIDEILIEVQGDYWHCNPNTRHADPKSKAQKNNLDRDKRKKSYIANNTNYKILYLWENDILNNIENVKICLKNLKK